jgi:NAD(P)-dependent dehydrogenase (short-subunit alcohol dehydrogenase family)
MLEGPLKQNLRIRDFTLSRVPMKRFGTPEEIAGAVLWMCSEESLYMTGREIVIGDGQAISS